MYIVIVSGSRFWTKVHEPIIERELRKLPQDALIVHGGAPGVDSLAGWVAERLGLRVEVFDAEWEAYGLPAGNIRNTRMLVERTPRLVLAFHEDLDGKSKGTKDLVKKARKMKIPVIVISE